LAEADHAFFNDTGARFNRHRGPLQPARRGGGLAPDAELVRRRRPSPRLVRQPPLGISVRIGEHGAATA
jgi:hypothetical protein